VWGIRSRQTQTSWIYSKGSNRKFWPKVTHHPVDLSVGDIWSQIVAEWLHIAHRSQWRVCRKIPSLFRMVVLLTHYDLPFPPNGVRYAPKIREWPYLRTGDSIHFMLGFRVWFSGLADGMALFLVTSNPSWWQATIFAWIISNGHIFTTTHSIHLYSAHRTVIFAIVQLSC